MTPGFGREYQGDSPFYEVWYGKVDIEPETALWFRYTILDGALREASTWAILFAGDRRYGGREIFEIEELAAPHTVEVVDASDPERFYGQRQVFHAEAGHLDEANAVGRAGEVQWDLHWRDSGRRFAYVPPALERLGVGSSAYDSCFLDLDVDGVVRRGERRWSFSGRPAMVGHIRGTRIAGERWSWLHCNDFDGGDDAVVEGLSVEMNALGAVTPPLTAFVAHIDGRRLTFRTPASIATASSSFGRDGWSFETESGGWRLSGEATPPEEVALVEYDDTTGDKLWCYNSKLSRLELTLEHRPTETTRRLVSEQSSAFEFVTREPPDRTPLI